MHLTREYDEESADATSREILAAIRPTQVAPAPTRPRASSRDARSPAARVRAAEVDCRGPCSPIPSSTTAAPPPPPPTPAVATDVSGVAVVRPDGRGVFGALRLGVERSTRQLVSVEDVDCSGRAGAA